MNLSLNDLHCLNGFQEEDACLGPLQFTFIFALPENNLEKFPFFVNEYRAVTNHKPNQASIKCGSI